MPSHMDSQTFFTSSYIELEVDCRFFIASSKMVSVMCRITFLFCLISLGMAKYVELHEIQPRLSMVGELAGKRYWMDTNTRFQQAAADYCRGLGYSPVQFDSLDEIEFLSTRLEPANYWTAGIDIATVDQYVWVQGDSSNPIAVQVENLVPYTGIYLDRLDNTLKVENIHTSMRPLCQQLVA